jgi:hypothetical protein
MSVCIIWGGAYVKPVYLTCTKLRQQNWNPWCRSSTLSSMSVTLMQAKHVPVSAKLTCDGDVLQRPTKLWCWRKASFHNMRALDSLIARAVKFCPSRLFWKCGWFAGKCIKSRSVSGKSEIFFYFIGTLCQNNVTKENFTLPASNLCQSGKSHFTLGAPEIKKIAALRRRFEKNIFFGHNHRHLT